MNTLSIKGIVLKEVTRGEGDKLLSVLTEDRGLITVNCRGVKTVNSKRFSSAQPLAYSDITLSERGGMYHFKEGEVIESFYGIRDSLSSIAVSSYIADTALSLSVEGQSDDGVLSLVLNSLYALSKAMYSPLFIKAVYEIRLSALLGFAPDLYECEICGKGEGEYFIDNLGGVVICADCALGESAHLSGRILKPIDSITLTAMRYIVSASPKRIFLFGEDKGVDIKILARSAEEYFLCHAERSFKSLDFLKQCIDY